MYSPNKQSRHVQVERKNDRRPMKPKAWTHQDELKSLIGKPVTVVYLDNACLKGVLLNADQFTLQIQAGSGVFTVFKSSLACYKEIKE